MTDKTPAVVWPDEAREDVRDALSGWPIGSGYYSSSVSVDDARELMALAFTALPPHVEAILDQARAEAEAEVWRLVIQAGTRRNDRRCPSAFIEWAKAQRGRAAREAEGGTDG